MAERHCVLESWNGQSCGLHLQDRPRGTSRPCIPTERTQSVTLQGSRSRAAKLLPFMKHKPRSALMHANPSCLTTAISRFCRNCYAATGLVILAHPSAVVICVKPQDHHQARLDVRIDFKSLACWVLLSLLRAASHISKPHACERHLIRQRNRPQVC